MMKGSAYHLFLLVNTYTLAQEISIAKPGCICPQYYDPVCCDGGIEFGNQCEASCANARQCKPGRCSKPCPCPKILAPVCCDGKDFNNQCLADCAGKTNCVEGKCDQVACRCAPIFKPVVCEGGKRFKNECEASCVGYSDCMDVGIIFPYPSPSECSCGNDEPRQKVCCGFFDEYENWCQARCAQSKLNFPLFCTSGPCQTLQFP
eukprot:TRINITY_DN134_c0_g1_i6.p1 TRINITY_DN134_c0_g1~~TRINITY_DN134_c0_g1_i6.p1  ORF type:complete len:205 (-),score=22.59 TRINITY_DN134_c0_g1_i6:335-949(-)